MDNMEDIERPEQTLIEDRNNNFNGEESETADKNEIEDEHIVTEDAEETDRDVHEEVVKTKKGEVTFADSENLDIEAIDKKNEESDDKADEKEGVDGEDDGEKEDKDEEEKEKEPPELTPEEKKAINEAVKEGDIDLLDDLLDLPGADINMDWFGENLLMTAIRARQLDMADFLIDNGVNYNFSSVKMERTTSETEEWRTYTTSCRELAYECDMWDVVELIDQLNGHMWPFLKPRQRQIRLKKPLEEKMKERGEWIEEEEEIDDEEEEVDPEEETESCGKSPSLSKKSTQSSLQKSSNHQYDDDDLSSGYETMSSSGASQSTVKIITVPERPVRPPQLYHVNKTYLTRKQCNTIYKDLLLGAHNTDDTTLPQYPRSPVKNAGWVEVKPREIRMKEEASPTRVITPWKNDDPIMLRNLHSRSKSASGDYTDQKYRKPTQSWMETLHLSKSDMHMRNISPTTRPKSESTLYSKSSKRRQKPKTAPSSLSMQRHDQKIAANSPKFQSKSEVHFDKLEPLDYRLTSSTIGFEQPRSYSRNSTKTRWVSPDYSRTKGKCSKKYSPAGMVGTSSMKGRGNAWGLSKCDEGNRENRKGQRKEKKVTYTYISLIGRAS